MDLLDDDAPIDLDDPEWPLRTYQPTRAPSRFVKGGLATCSIVAPGGVVAGRVHRCVLFAGASIGSGSSAEGCLVLPDARIGLNCRLRNVVVDAGCVVPDGTVLDGGAVGAPVPAVAADGGVCLVTPQTFAGDVCDRPSERKLAGAAA